MNYAQRPLLAASLGLSVLAVVVAVGCGHTEDASQRQSLGDAAAETGAGQSCQELAQAARVEVSAVIEAHQTCAVDADCTSTSLSAQCFDSCSRVVSTTAVADVKAARDKVNGAQCKQFLAQGCKVLIPPCAPPSPPRCTSGVCAGG